MNVCVCDISKCSQINAETQLSLNNRSPSHDDVSMARHHGLPSLSFISCITVLASHPPPCNSIPMPRIDDAFVKHRGGAVRSNSHLRVVPLLALHAPTSTLWIKPISYRSQLSSHGSSASQTTCLNMTSQFGPMTPMDEEAYPTMLLGPSDLAFLEDELDSYTQHFVEDGLLGGAGLRFPLGGSRSSAFPAFGIVHSANRKTANAAEVSMSRVQSPLFLSTTTLVHL